ncbi:hypothetical protein GALMADRAFT_1084665 [Galerina marginata CBS 339.88]|uniref:Uncharacterized protein n=1 Tax=Galerina marginata (strain CBS 339.88) TaxID=685588 RepID=A0A067S952_GALM3|nr:hypothetical protein GALMADRAFT_1084665 [Galerina marginata CBS 339.88]
MSCMPGPRSTLSAIFFVFRSLESILSIQFSQTIVTYESLGLSIMFAVIARRVSTNREYDKWQPLSKTLSTSIPSAMQPICSMQDSCTSTSNGRSPAWSSQSVSRAGTSNVGRVGDLAFTCALSPAVFI